MAAEFNQFRKWLAFGTGVGIEIGERDLYVSVARIRPSGAELAGVLLIERFRERPAGEWGAEYAAFLKKHGGEYLAATVLLPRDEVIVRQLSMPGVADRDLAQAILFQIDGLHPYREEDAMYDYSRLGDSPNVLVGITRREVVDRYSTLFVEAGVKIARFTFSAAVIYSALRLLSAPPEGFLGIERRDGVLEAYGESAARPLFSAAFEIPSEALAERAQAMALAELRLPAETEVAPISSLLPRPVSAPEGVDLSAVAMPYATALASACPRLSLRLNLLPPALRENSSRLMYVPAIALGVLLLLSAGALSAYSAWLDRSYLDQLRSEIGRLEPEARKPMQMDHAIEDARKRSMLLDNFRSQTRADLDALNEVTRLVAPPGWANSLELTRDAVRVFGETENASGLLKVLDASPLFDSSEFALPITHTQNGDTFSIRAHREGAAR
jgi:hypothetical protein